MPEDKMYCPVGDERQMEMDDSDSDSEELNKKWYLWKIWTWRQYRTTVNLFHYSKTILIYMHLYTSSKHIMSIGQIQIYIHYLDQLF